jgi:hypothetical protein
MAKISKDLLWKAIIEDFFEDFLKYFYPNAEEIFDFSKGFEFLDKELEKLTRPSYTKNRVADKLVKTYTKSGKEQWILIHIEVQGYVDNSFDERMFTYYYRIFDKYKKPIEAFVLFTDDSPNYRPNSYRVSFLNTSINYTYGIFKLSDYTPKDFQKSDNPFAIVLETAWYGLKKNKLSDENLFSLKLDLARRLYAKGFPKGTFSRMCGFIRDYVSFGNSELLPKLESEIDEINKPAKPMGILELIEQETRKQATKQGLAEGRRVGRQEGRQEGAEQTLIDSIQKLYRKGFSVESISEMLEIQLDFVKNAVK